MRRVALALFACQLMFDARVLLFALAFRWLPAEYRDGSAAGEAIEAALAADGDVI